MSDNAPPSEHVEEVIELPEKVEKKIKKPRTEAQKKATQAALEALKAKREAKQKDEVAQKEAKEIARTQWKAAKKHTPEDQIPTKKDFDNFKSDVMMVMRGFMQSNATPAPPTEVKKEPTAIQRKTPAAPAPTITQAPAPKPQPQKLTGHALLDQLFFNQ